MPHYGHLLTGFVKDAVPRYQTMRGRRVERRFGWDCHGLPAETEAERELGVSGRAQITAFGIDRFNDYCKTSVLRYTAAWERYVTRQGRWVDFDNDYKTMDASYMESVIWAFKTLYERGLIYEGQRVLPYCWECETPLSNFETRQDDAYRDRVDPAVTVVISLDAAPDGSGPAAGPLHVLTWTTTPWTLPSNLALAVGPEISYAVYERRGERYLVGESRAEVYADLLDRAILVGAVAGAELVGRTYRPLFGYFADEPNAFRVLAADFVTTEEGTGIVHIAPGFGEDDQRLCEENGIAVVCPVDGRGRFDDRVPDLAGLQVFEANERVIENLARSGSLVRREEYVHSYPHCWRSETPLIYRAVASYFVRVTAIKDRMVELNRQIHWVPEHVGQGAFGKWLEGARDWSITRNRFWGAPIPVWTSDDPAWPGASTSSPPTSGSAPTTSTVRGSTPSRGRIPTIRRDARQCGAWRTSSTAGSSPARCPLPNSTTRSRTRHVSRSTSRRISSASTSARPAAGSTRCTSWRRRSSTGRLSRTASRTGSCSATTAASSPSA
jgi:isoleucyl-tRNA synthetase